jgi:hypothetical protein
VRVVGFACAVSLIAGILFSLTPVLRLSWSNMREGLGERGRGFSGTTWRRFGSNFVVIELAMAMVLLVGAGLLGKSLYRLLQANTGLQADHLATLRVGADKPQYSKNEQVIALERSILARVASLPGVKSIGITNKLPLGDGDGTTQFRILGRPFHGEHNEVVHRQVSAGYFPTLEARLMRGRYFTDASALPTTKRSRSSRWKLSVSWMISRKGSWMRRREPPCMCLSIRTQAAILQLSCAPRSRSSQCSRNWPPPSIRSIQAFWPSTL